MTDKSESGRRRKWAPKARTGCRTCKTRHVKCDEARPVCRRCILSGFRCDGYALASNNSPDENGTSSPSEGSPERLQSATPDLQCSTPTMTSLDTPTPTIETSLTAVTTPSTSSPHLFLTPSEPFVDDERYCLQLYNDLTSSIVARSNAAPYFWKTLVPQAAWSYPGVRHAMCAAALSSDSLLRRDSPEVAHQTHMKVLMHASKAVNSLLTEKVPLDVVMLTSATLGVLDLFEGEWETAITHVTSGAKLAITARQEAGSDPYISFYCEAFAAALPTALTRYPNAKELPAAKISRVRLQEAVSSLELAIANFDGVLGRLESHCSPIKDQISRIIYYSRYESAWLKSRWEVLLQHELSTTSPPDDQPNSRLHLIESPWSVIMNELEIYLTHGGLFDLAKFEIAMERTLPFYIFAKSGPDIRMRQDATELLYVGFQLRSRSRATLNQKHAQNQVQASFDGS